MVKAAGADGVPEQDFCRPETGGKLLVQVAVGAMEFSIVL
jgi:hypothetical protein